MRTDESLRQVVAKVIAEEVAPAMGMDGTAVEVVGIENGVVQLRFTGACGGCPSTIMTVIMGVEQELRRHVPEVEYVEAVP